MAQPGLKPESWQDKEVHVDWRVLSAARSHYPVADAGGDIGRVAPAWARRPSARLGLHAPAWTRGAPVPGRRVVALPPPFPSARRAGRPGAPAAPAAGRLGSCTDHSGGKVSTQAAARRRPEGSATSPRGNAVVATELATSHLI